MTLPRLFPFTRRPPPPELSPALRLAVAIERWDCPEGVSRSVCLGLDAGRANVSLRTEGVDVMAEISIDASPERIKSDMDFLLFRLMMWRDRLVLPALELNLPEITLTRTFAIDSGRD